MYSTCSILNIYVISITVGLVRPGLGHHSVLTISIIIIIIIIPTMNKHVYTVMIWKRSQG